MNMKGYFFRLAKHSGLRYSEPDGGARAEREKPAAHLPAPPGIEETVLVPPTEAAESPLDSPRQKRQRQTAEQQTLKAVARQKQSPAIGEDVPTREHEKSALQRPSEAVRKGSSGPSELEKMPQAAREEKALAASKPAGEMRVVERTVFATASPPGTGAQADPEKPEELKTNTVKAEPFEKAEKKRHFTKTAEAIELGNPDPVEIQRILLHEVQEWAAAAPTEAAVQDLKAAKAPENVVKHQIVLAVPELGVVTVRDEKPMERAENAEGSGLEEQSFNLSIGTISVVIEDAAKPVQQPEPRRQNEGNQSTRRESARQFSRLSRNYL